MVSHEGWCQDPDMRGGEARGRSLVLAWLCLHMVCSFPWVRAYASLWQLLKLSLCLTHRCMSV